MRGAWNFAKENAAGIGAAVAGSEAGRVSQATTIAVNALEKIPILGLAATAFKKTIGIVGDALEGYSKQAAKNISHLGDAAAAVLRGDFAAARQQQLAKEIDETGKEIFGSIRLWWNGQRQQLAAIGASRAITQAVGAEASRLAPYSGQLSGAQATSEIIKLRSDMRAAQELGPLLSIASVASAQREAALQAALMPVKKQMIEQGIQMLQNGSMTMEEFKALQQTAGDTNALLASLKEGSDVQIAVAKEYLKELKKQKDESKDFDMDGLVGSFVEGLKLLPDKGDDLDMLSDTAVQQALTPLH